MLTKPKWYWLLSLLLLTLGGEAQFSPSAWAAEPVELKISYGAPSGSYAPIWLAQDEGLFAKAGLKTDLKYIPPATAVQALLGRSLDIASPGPGLLEARLGGADLVYIGALVNRFVFSVYSKPELQTLADLKGKVLAVTQPGAATDFAARILLKGVGLAPGKDTQITYLKGGAEILTGLIQGVADAGILSVPITLKARQAGLKELVDVTAKHVPMIQSDLGTTRKFLKDHSDVVRRYLQAVVEGMKIARTNPERTKQIIGKYMKMSHREELEETYKTVLPAWDKVPYVTTAAVQAVLDFSQNPAARTAKPEQFIDNSLLTELERSGFVERLYRP